MPLRRCKNLVQFSNLTLISNETAQRADLSQGHHLSGWNLWSYTLCMAILWFLQRHQKFEFLVTKNVVALCLIFWPRTSKRALSLFDKPTNFSYGEVRLTWLSQTHAQTLLFVRYSYPMFRRQASTASPRMINCAADVGSNHPCFI